MVTSLPAHVADRVDRVLREFLAGQRDRLGAIAADMAPVVDAAVEFLAGGKRLRPAFAYWGWRGAGGEESGPAADAMVAAASSLELLHASALLHDDVMDGSDTRRGRPTAHRRFAALHRDSGWSGSPESFGAAAAILLGDLCLMWSTELLHGCGLDHAAVHRGLAVYDRMCGELIAGQYLDVLEQARGAGTVEAALRVARYKTAAYTVERPLHLGARLAGGSAELLAAYSGYGAAIGEAYQLRDDVLGVYGDPARTGKPAGDDLREGKRTVLVALAALRSPPADAAELHRLLGDPALSPAGVTTLRELISASGALAEMEMMITERVGRGLDALATGPVEPAAAQALRDLAVAATARSG